MEEKLLTTGEFANLANTSKRTVQFYDRSNILNPHKVNAKGYRFYKPHQIIDMQVILLMKTLGLSLKEIKQSLKKQNFKTLFEKRKDSVQEEIDYLTHTLKKLEHYYKNLADNSTLVKPEIKRVEDIEYYFTEKIGSYAQIGCYCTEFIKLFNGNPEDMTTLAIFLHEGYKPQNSRIRIGLLKNNEISIKPGNENLIKESRIPSHLALTYMHRGDGKTMSLMWQETYKYMQLNDITAEDSIPEYEIYWEISEKEYENKFELYIPVKNSNK